MKIIHCADLHLGSTLASKFPKQISDKRRSELLSTFSRLIKYAQDNDVRLIILSGDVFDSDKPTIKDREFFYSAVQNNPGIDFLYLNGNHDKEGSYLQISAANFKTFSKSAMTSYTYGNLVISGIEMDETNAESFYSMIDLDKTKLNILMLHGDVSDSKGMDKVKISELRDKGIDYLALGHIHSYSTGRIDERGSWAFPGCLEGRGFDECGEKGFILLDVSDVITPTFVPFAGRTIHRIRYDVTGLQTLYDIQNQLTVQTAGISSDDILRVELEGELNADIDLSENDVTSALARFFFVNVKNRTTFRIDPNDYINDTSLIGEFVRGISASTEYDDEQKNKLIAVGLRVLNGREVE